MESFEELLFQPQGAVAALFKNKSDLAREIALLRSTTTWRNRYAGRAASIATLLALISRGERGCPPDLREAICRASSSRSAAMKVALPPAFLEQVGIATRLRKAAPQPAQALVARALFQELVNLAKEANEQFIITGSPAEETPGSIRAKVLREILVDRYGLYEGAPPPASPPRYTFCLPERAAESFWRFLEDEVTSDRNPCGNPLSLSAARSKLQALDHRNFLQVWQVAEHVCGCPVVLFWISDVPTAAFTLFYHGSDGISVAKFDDYSLRFWYTSIYQPLLHNLKQLWIRRIAYRPVSSTVRSEGSRKRTKRKPA